MSTSEPNLSSATASAEPFAVGAVQGARSPLQSDGPFVDRRKDESAGGASERRQFGSSHEGLSEAGKELALAIDQYKLQHHRRYITCDEMLLVITQLGYQKQ